MYGYKTPNFKSDVELISFLNKSKVKSNSLYTFKSWEDFLKALKLKYSRIPDAYFFNSEGYLVSYRKTTSDCNSKVDTFISELNNLQEMNFDNSKRLSDYIELLTNNKNEPLNKDEITVIISWASYLGKTNKIKAFEWIKLLEQAKEKGLKINYYLVNYDLQEKWNLSIEERKEILEAF
jgi:hypothetical protein